MKKKTFLPPFLILLMTALTGCGNSGDNNKEPLSGSYEAGTEYGKTVYTFGEDNTVTVSYISLGYKLLSQDGTYEWNDDRTLITLHFSTENLILPQEISSLGGSFSYSETEDTITIGNIVYSRQEEGPI